MPQARALTVLTAAFLLTGCGGPGSTGETGTGGSGGTGNTTQAGGSAGAGGTAGSAGAGGGSAGAGGGSAGSGGAGGSVNPGGCGCPTGSTCDGVWLSAAEIAALPGTGEAGCDARCEEAWKDLVDDADKTPAPPDLTDQDESTNTTTMAKAIVYAKTGNTAYRDEIIALLKAVVGTECGDGMPGFHKCDGVGARSLAVGRKLAAYIIAADIIDLAAAEPDFDKNTFRPWLEYVLVRPNEEGRTIQTCHEERPNNWGTHCGATRAAIAVYLGDEMEIKRTAQVFRGWLGDRNAYAGFQFQAVSDSWMADPGAPVPVNPKGAKVEGHNVDGVLVDDQSRSGPFVWPPLYTDYAYGGQEGAIVQAHILARRGHDVFTWSDAALRRAVEWMFYDGEQKEKWDTSTDTNKAYVLDLVDHAYGTAFSPMGASRPGRNVTGTSFTHRHCK